MVFCRCIFQDVFSLPIVGCEVFATTWAKQGRMTWPIIGQG